jgi:penicillin-insensitive murein endopeptidase
VGVARLAVLTLLGVAGCSALGPFSDGSSVSFGWTNRGRILNAVALPIHGDGYQVPPSWAARGLNWGTEELVGVIVRAGRRLSVEGAGTPFYVADLSPKNGGPSSWHRSHQAGRDADLLFFATDDAGRPAPAPSAMVPFDDHGDSADGRHFDVARNWMLVRALVEDQGADVQFLFISSALRQMLLDYARNLGEPPDLVERAEAVLLQPGDAPPHDDHLHVRIYCPASDRAFGCHERGPMRWFKKGYKYFGNEAQLLARLLEGTSVPRFCELVAPRTLSYL